MKTRILFVDDEPLVLQGLQRMLRPMREEWDMEFVESGAKALAAMAKNPFEAVVSDMCMPGMNGAQLLNQVMKSYPKTIRLILSGHADQDLVLKCVGSAHQFLSKPCEPETLKATVRRASALGAALQNDSLVRLVSQMERLPSIPSLYVEVIEKLQSPEASLDDLGDIIARDIDLTAEILKLVNSAFFGLRRQISSASEAVCYLGLDTIKSLVLSISVFSQFQVDDLKTLPLQSLWSHSLTIARGAKLIAKLEDCEAKVVDESFAAGMLHDTGKLILAFNFSKAYVEILERSQENPGTLLDTEREVFGATHAEIGGYLLGLWGLPIPVVEAIALHHTPGLSANKTFSPLTCVHLANGLIKWQKPMATPQEPPIDLTYIEELGVAERLDSWKEALSGLAQ